MQDLRYALRTFRRAPLFALTVVGTIALALGLNAAVFTIFNAYALRPAAVRDPYSIYEFTWQARAGFHAFSWPEYEELSRNTSVFSELFTGRRQVLSRLNGRPAYGHLVTGNYFQLAGVNAVLGRTLLPDDARPPAGNTVVVLAFPVWQHEFGGDANIVGQKVIVNGHPVEVVGVAPEGFLGLDLLPHDFWAPITLGSLLDPGTDLFGPAQPRQLEIVGRLKPGVSQSAATSALLIWAQQKADSYPDDQKPIRAVLESKATPFPLRSIQTGKFAVALSPLYFAAAMVLLIACANVANMLLARSMARRREVGIRLAIGASRTRLVRQFLTESLLLAVPAAAASLAVSWIAIEFFVRRLIATFPAEVTQYIRVQPLSLDGRVVLFTFAAALLAALSFSLAPALTATNPAAINAARGGFMPDGRTGRLKSALIVVQIATSAVFLIVAGVLLRGAAAVASLDTGMRTDDTIVVYVRDAGRGSIVSALEAEPLVRSVAATKPGQPIALSTPRITITSEQGTSVVSASLRAASPEYFQTFEIPLIGGRNFTPAEAVSEAPVAIVSATAARRLWPGESAVGQSIRVSRTVTGQDASAPSGGRASSLIRHDSLQVVGIARDVVVGWIDDAAERTGVYVPTSVRQPDTTLVVQVNGPVESASRRLDSLLAAVSPGAVEQMTTVQAFADIRTHPLRVAYWIWTAIGLLALVLTSSGIYGVLSYLVSQRTKEIGIRMALGATVAAASSLVFRHTLKLTAIGLTIGFLIAFGASTLASSLLVMIDTFDAVGFLIGLGVVLGFCLAAASIPAFRAARINPIETLRQD